MNSTRPSIKGASKEIEEGFRAVGRKLAIDRLTVEVVDAFAGCGIETLLLKGPVLGEWLYPGEVRPYCDSDLMVAPGDRARAVRVLEGLGFRAHRPWMPSPLGLDPGGTAYERGDDKIDLHCVLPGLEGEPNAIWSSLIARSAHQILDGTLLRVPDRDALLLHVCLHAAHHANYAECKPFEDLRRAIARATDEQWDRSLELARAYGGVGAFAAGLRIVPEGWPLARRLGIEDVRSHRFGLRREDNVIAEEISALFSTQVGLRRKLATVISELFPRVQYMRWRSPLARRGRLGLAAAYAWRPLWAVCQLPGAVAALWRSRQRGQAAIEPTGLGRREAGSPEVAADAASRAMHWPVAPDAAWRVRRKRSLEMAQPLTPWRKMRLAVEIVGIYVPTRARVVCNRLRLPAQLKDWSSARASSRSGELSPRETTTQAIRLGSAVARMLDLLPTDSSCLTRTLVLARLLSRHGIESSVVIGVDNDGESFIAHAWVEHRGMPLLDPGPEALTRLVRLDVPDGRGQDGERDR